MIIKKREKPEIILKLEALSRRLHKNHPKQGIIKENLARRNAGYKGEQSLDYYLASLSDEKYHILHGLRLFDEINYFQMDTLLISQNFILILEVKNISGTLLFDPAFNQLIRIQDDKEEAFPDPISQVNRHQAQLSSWLSINKLLELPIETLVVISNPNSTIKALSNHQFVQKKVIHSAALLSRIRSFEQKYKQEYVGIKEMKKISKQLSRKHVPIDSQLLERYEISKDELITGVQYQDCSYLPMKRIHSGWYCPSCRVSSKQAHIEALKDYSLLINSVVTNQEIKQFLQLSSISTTTRLLSSLNLTQNGECKGRKYHLDCL